MCHPAFAWDFEWGKVIPKTKGTLSLLPQDLGGGGGKEKGTPQIIRGGPPPFPRLERGRDHTDDGGTPQPPF